MAGVVHEAPSDPTLQQRQSGMLKDMKSKLIVLVAMAMVMSSCGGTEKAGSSTPSSASTPGVSSTPSLTPPSYRRH